MFSLAAKRRAAVSQQMDQVLGQDPVVSFLKARIQSPPHFILVGPTGTGKTMLVNAFIKAQLVHQGVTLPRHLEQMVLRLTSADDRGITVIRQRLTEFVRRVRPVPGTFAWIIIDDADNLPAVTQQALRRILELHVMQARFCFIAQTTDHFIEPIQSRCVVLKTEPVDLLEHGPTLVKREALSGTPTVSEDAIQLAAALCQGNARQFVLICRAIAAAFEPGTTVTAADIHVLVNAPPVKTLLALQAAIADKDIARITEAALTLWSRGYSFEECISMLETIVMVYNAEITEPLQYVLQCCAEAHIYQILNKTTTIDLIAVLSGATAPGVKLLHA